MEITEGLHIFYIDHRTRQAGTASKVLSLGMRQASAKDELGGF